MIDVADFGAGPDKSGAENSAAFQAAIDAAAPRTARQAAIQRAAGRLREADDPQVVGNKDPYLTIAKGTVAAWWPEIEAAFAAGVAEGERRGHEQARRRFWRRKPSAWWHSGEVSGLTVADVPPVQEG